MRKLIHICIHICSLSIEKLRDGMIKLRIGDPMARPGCRRREAPSKLVFSLGSRLEPAETLVYAVFDSLVVAGFEVQACLLYTSPSPRDATLSRMASSA